MYDTKATAGTAEREQLLRIQRELEEKYANESRPQYAGERLHEQPAAFGHSVPAEYREHDDKCEHCRRDTDCPAKPRESITGFLSGLLSGISLDDLILIGIGILLLMDGEEGNDIILILILALLFF